jgi:hypothetical protein
MLQQLVIVVELGVDDPRSVNIVQTFRTELSEFLNAVKEHIGNGQDVAPVVDNVVNLLNAAIRLNRLGRTEKVMATATVVPGTPGFRPPFSTTPSLKRPAWRIGLLWMVLCEMGKVAGKHDYDLRSAHWIDQLLLKKAMVAAVQSLECEEARAWHEADLVRVLVVHRRWLDRWMEDGYHASHLEALLSDPDVRQLIGVHEYEHALWCNKEAFEELMNWLLGVSTLDCVAARDTMSPDLVAALRRRYEAVQGLVEAGAQCSYKLDELIRSQSAKAESR